MRLHSLKTRLAIQTALLAAAAVLVVGWLIYQALVRQELALQQVSLKSAAGQIARVVERARADTLFMTKLPSIGGIIRTRGGQADPKDGSTRADWKDRLETIFADLMVARPEYFQVRFIGLADGGLELVRVERRDGRPVAATTMQRKGQRDYFRQLAKAAPGTVYVSPFDLNIEHGRLEIPYRPTLRLGAAVFGPDGERFGMVVLNLDAGALLRRLAAERPGHRVFYLTNPSGDFLVHPDPQRTFGFAVGASFRIQKDLPASAAFLADAGQDSALVPDGGPNGQMLHLVRERFDPQNPHRYVVLAEASDFGGLLSSSASVRAQALQVTLVAALVVALLAWLSAASIVAPLDRLNRAAKALGSGDRDVQPDVSRPDELGELAASFSQMAAQVSDREAQLERERERLALYLRHGPSALTVLDQDLNYQIASDRWLQQFGLEGEDITGRGLFGCGSALPGRWSAALRDGVANQCEDSGEDSVELSGVGTQWLRWASHPWWEVDGTFGGLVLVAENITARKQAEQALRERSYQLASAERIARVGSWIWDPRADHFFLSEESRSIHGVGHGDQGFGLEVLLDAVHPDDRDRVTEAMHALRLEQAPLDIRYQLADGLTHIRAISRAERVGGASTGRLLGTWQDITQQVIVEARLRDVARRLGQSNRELEEFASVASHDLQEPLRKIQAFGDRLRGKFADALGEQGGDYLRRMQESAARMSRLINDLLDYSRVSSKAQPFEPVDLNELMSAVLQDLEVAIEQHGAEVTVDRLPTVSADATQLRQLLQNLLGNAVKYHRPDVVPRVQVSADAVAELPDGLETQNDYVAITVSDNGIGFDTAYAERIFQPFQRLHGRGEYQGTGIGLATCRKIVERHGGVIVATGTPGEGSSFRVILPRSRPDYNQPTGDQANVA